MNRYVVSPGVFHTAQHEHLCSGRRHLQHFLETDLVEPGRVRHDPRICGEDPVDIGVDLTHIGVQRGGQRDGGGIGATPPERRHILAVLAHTLESGDQDNLALVQRGAQTAGRDVDDLGAAVLAGGDHAGL
ncbi:Uncharacterised protein [Mycobacteroides abscessus subsp. abscessus]|nr:Uncharacterised protein [Mycobacteroides abscessus subsp. abscessus]